MNKNALPVKYRVDLGWNELKKEGLSDFFSKIFASRGITKKEQISSQKLLLWHDLKDIEKAVDRLELAIDKKEKIVIVADYDSDGATSCAIALLALKAFGAEVDFSVPNRFVHGYGLTSSVVEAVKKEKSPKVILTVDNGVSSFDGICLANELQIDVIVTDHHLAGESLPPAYCIVNPNQKGCLFPSKNLAGCGVVFYVMAALRDRLEKSNKLPENTPPIQTWLDFVAIGTIADVVKLDENNRILAKLGLDRIRKGKAHPGLAALFTVAKRNTSRATSKDIGFAIGPRINAAGRLDDMSIGIRCLIEPQFQEALALALALDDLNNERKKIEKEMQGEANHQVWEGQEKYQSGLTVFNEDFHEGVIGIVAGRIKEQEHRPTIVFARAQEDNAMKGSGRSIPGFHLRDALDLIFKKKPGMIKKFGGHAMAAGLTIDSRRWNEFREDFNAVCEEQLTEDILERYVLVDGCLDPKDANVHMAEQIAAQVWGQGFPEPVFCWEVTILEQKILNGAHLKLKVEKDGLEFESIWFFQNEEIKGNKAELVFSLELKEFRKEISIQLQVIQAQCLD